MIIKEWITSVKLVYLHEAELFLNEHSTGVKWLDSEI